MPALDGDLPETLFGDAVITGQQGAAGLFLSEALQFIRQEADEGGEQRVGALKDLRIRAMHERMGRVRVAGEEGEILFTECQELIDNGLHFVLLGLLEVLPELGPLVPSPRNRGLPRRRAIVFEPLHIRFVEQAAGRGPNGHAGVRRIVVLDRTIEQCLP